MKRIFIFLASTTVFGIASGQTVSIGVKGGVPLLDQTTGPQESRPYMIGPSVEVHLFGGFAVEADALYQRLGTTLRFDTIVGAPGVSYLNRERGNSWEFPLLGKYYFRSRDASWRPFVGTGYAFRTIGLHEAISGTLINSQGGAQNISARVSTRSDLGIGATFSAGFRLKLRRIAVLPEIRYTRWGSQDTITRKNEAGFLLGVNF